MARIKIDLPDLFSFRTSLDVRITDLNYGGHVGNDQVLTFLHEARMRFLVSMGYTELNLEGISLIMADAALVFKNEIFYGDQLLIHIKAVDFSLMGFDLLYKVEKKSLEVPLIMAIAKTAMICFDYEMKKVTSLPDAAKIKLSA